MHTVAVGGDRLRCPPQWPYIPASGAILSSCSPPRALFLQKWTDGCRAAQGWPRRPRGPFPTTALCACPPIRRARHSSNPLGRANSLLASQPSADVRLPSFWVFPFASHTQGLHRPKRPFCSLSFPLLSPLRCFSSPSLSLKVSFNSHRRPVLYQPALPFCSAFCCSRCLRSTPRRLPGPRPLDRASTPVLNSRARPPSTPSACPVPDGTSSQQQRRRRRVLPAPAVSRQSLAALRTWSNRTAIVLVARNSWNE